MPKKSKRYKACKEKLGKSQFELEEAIDRLLELESAKFDETVEVSIKLGVDPKKSDQQVRGSIVLPNGIGRKRSVIVFAEGKDAEAAKKAGAFEVGSTDLVKKIQDGWLDFDVAIATPDMMRYVGKLGRILGPKGKMPSPKSGTVTKDIENTVKEFEKGKVEYRMDATSNAHIPVGKKSFSKEALLENITALLNHVKESRPASARGTFIQKIAISSTMSPAVGVVVK